MALQRKSWHSSSASRSKLGIPFPSLRINLHSNSRTIWHRSTTHTNNMTVQFLSKRRQTELANPIIRKVRPAWLSPRKLNASASSHMTPALSIARVRVRKIVNRRSRWSGFVVKPCARFLMMFRRKRFGQIKPIQRLPKARYKHRARQPYYIPPPNKRPPSVTRG